MYPNCSDIYKRERAFLVEGLGRRTGLERRGRLHSEGSFGTGSGGLMRRHYKLREWS